MRLRRSTMLLGMIALLGGCGAPDVPPPTGPTPLPSLGSPEPSTREELLALAAQWPPRPLTIAYSFEVASGDRGTVRLIAETPSAWRLDFETGGGTTTLLRRGQRWFVCSGQGKEGTCSRSETPERLPAPVPAPFLEYLVGPGDLSAALERRFPAAEVEKRAGTIAGVSADCYVPAGGGEEWCFGADGTLLRIAAEDFTLQAIEVARDVQAKDLEPPYPAADIRP